jgi:hypothetical protein
MKKPLDTIIILVALGVAGFWLNERFNHIHQQLTLIESHLRLIKSDLMIPTDK